MAASFNDIVATTLRGYSRKIADNVTTHNALLWALDKKSNIQNATGRTIVQEIEYQENQTVKWYSGAETLDISAGNVLTDAEFEYKQLAGNVVITGLEEIKNSGREAVHNLLKARIRNLEHSLKNTMATALFATGTGNSGKEIGGLQHLIADDPSSGVVGGIDRASYSFWQNKKFDASAETAVATAISATNIKTAMNLLYLRCLRGTDQPDIIIFDDDYYNNYWESLQEIQRITDTKMGAAGFDNLKYKSAAVLYDANCPDKHGYFLNTDYLFLRPAKDRAFVPLETRNSVNQDANVMPMVWAGNMTSNGPKFQGVMFD